MTYLQEIPSDIERPTLSSEDVLRQVAHTLRELKIASPEEQRLWLLSSEPISTARILERIANDAETEAAIVRGLTEHGIRIGKVERLFPREILRSGSWERAQ